MRDVFGRSINYLRISVTDRCNFRCTYCMPREGIGLKKEPKDILTFEKIVEIIKVAVSLGFDRFRLTGGEPLVRRGIVQLVKKIAMIPGVKDLSMTTNGSLLSKYAESLKSAGLNRINISLDTLDPSAFFATTQSSELEAVLQGIDAAIIAGFYPIKINCVIEKSLDEPSARAIKAFAYQKGLMARFIPKMNLREGKFSIVEEGGGGDCKRCNRLRLLSDGSLRPCLFSDQSFSTRDLGILPAFKEAILQKPEKGIFCSDPWMYGVGG